MPSDEEPCRRRGTRTGKGRSAKRRRRGNQRKRIQVRRETGESISFFTTRSVKAHDVSPRNAVSGGICGMCVTRHRRVKKREFKKEMAPAPGFEPGTKWLTATYSTIELCRSVYLI